MNAFILKYNSDGDEECTQQFGTSGIDAVSGVSVDSSGGVYVAGETDGTFPGQTSEEETDAFLAKFAIDHDHGDKKKKDHDHDAKKKH